MDEPMVEALRKLKGVTAVERVNGSLVLHCSRDVRSDIARRVVGSGASLNQLKVRGHVLEEIYLRYFREG